MARLLTPNVEALLMVGALPEGNKWKDVSNDSKVFTAADIQRLRDIATGLGVDFDNTGYTFTVSVRNDERVIYDVTVALKDGQPTLFWGNSATPLPTKGLSIDTVDGKSFLAYEYETVIDEEDHFETIHIPMTLKVLSEVQEEGKKYPTRTYATSDQLKSALKRGKLAEFLDVRKTFILPESMDSLEPGEYRVVGYQKNRFGKYEVQFEDGTWYKLKGNANKRMEAQPLIDAQHVAVLTVGVGEPSTYQGKPCIKLPTSILFWADTVPVGEVITKADGSKLEVFAL